MIDLAFRKHGARTFADLGGVWHVDGGYSFYTLREHAAEAGVLVDHNLTDALLEQARQAPRLRIVQGNFGEPAIAEEVGEVDVVYQFDTLLHQVAPAWNEVLELYAPRTKTFAIVQPQWKGERTVRLLDLEQEEYIRSVAPPNEFEEMRALLAKADEYHPERGRAFRDMDALFQWGITDADLIAALDALGFDVAFSRDWGSFRGLERFDRRAFVFTRR